MTDKIISDVQGLVHGLTAQIGDPGRLTLIVPSSLPVNTKVTLEQHFPDFDVVMAMPFPGRTTHKSKFDPRRKEEERKAKAREIVAKLRERSQQKHDEKSQ